MDFTKNTMRILFLLMSQSHSIYQCLLNLHFLLTQGHKEKHKAHFLSIVWHKAHFINGKLISITSLQPLNSDKSGQFFTTGTHPLSFFTTMTQSVFTTGTISICFFLWHKADALPTSVQPLSYFTTMTQSFSQWAQ